MDITSLDARLTGSQPARRFLFLLSGLLFLVLITGCGKLAGLGVQKVEAKTDQESLEVFYTYQDVLIGKDGDAVVEVFGKPKGIFERHNSTVWMYARWKVEFNGSGIVTGMERDIASTGAAPVAKAPSMAVAPRRPPTEPSVKLTGAVTRISQGGQTVDLNALVAPGKVTVIEFYADWCGPCRRASPFLEKIARDNEDVVLVKIDIVKWGTPVTEQYNIQSVPNIRVFNRQGLMVGAPTANLHEVAASIHEASL